MPASPAPRAARRRSRDPDHIVHKDKDLRIPDTTPEKVAQALMRGGAKPRPDTKRP